MGLENWNRPLEEISTVSKKHVGHCALLRDFLAKTARQILFKSLYNLQNTRPKPETLNHGVPGHLD